MPIGNAAGSAVLRHSTAGKLHEQRWKKWLPCLLIAWTAHAENVTTRSDRGGFALTFPGDHFELVEPPPKGVELALRHTGTFGFPTLNIIARPGSFDTADATIKDTGEAVVSSYRKLGLTDARLTAARELPIAGTISATFTLAYHSVNVPYLAQVYLIPGVDRHLIVTIVSPEEAAVGPHGIAELSAVVENALTVANPPPVDIQRSGSRKHLVAISIVALVLLMVGLAITRHGRSK